MLSDSRSAFVKQCRYSVLSTPDGFFGIHHLHAILLTLRLENQELGGAVPNHQGLRG